MLVVFGASGGIGRRIVELALSHQQPVRAVYRLPPTLAHPLLETCVIADVTRSEGIAPALRGATAVLSALGLRRRVPLNPWSRIISPPDLTARFAAALRQALPGPVPVVAVSAAGVGDSPTSWPVRQLIHRSNLAPAYRDLDAMEQTLLSLPGAVCVRPTTLTNARPTGSTRITPRYTLLSRIPRADVAAYMLDRCRALHPEHGRTPMITAVG